LCHKVALYKFSTLLDEKTRCSTLPPTIGSSLDLGDAPVISAEFELLGCLNCSPDPLGGAGHFDVLHTKV
jgi:hypothetical protein